VAQALIEMVEREDCDLILTTGGTGPAPRDLTPEAMRMVITRELEGFGELMRRISLEEVPTAILSRQTAGTRGKCLIVNLPGRPSAIDVCLNAVFPAIPYCLDLIGARRIEVNPDVCAAFRPAA
jgi:molybdopterin adenylyltransferase